MRFLTPYNCIVLVRSHWRPRLSYAGSLAPAPRTQVPEAAALVMGPKAPVLEAAPPALVPDVPQTLVSA